jgi:hypothetical protein
MLHQQVDETAARFWEELGEEEPFPRDLEKAILYARPLLSIEALVGLRPRVIQAWLQRRGHRVELETYDRRLNGCLYAVKGRAFIFLDKDLSPDDRRVVLGHEFGHFLLDYEAPRERAARRLGQTVLPVLDGVRGATASEQLSATLAGLNTEPYVHFMDRNPDGSYVEPVSEVECRADAMSLEFLAPWRTVFADMQRKCVWPGEIGEWEEHLMTRFGLPQGWARHYAGCLIAKARGRLSFSQALGL